MNIRAISGGRSGGFTLIELLVGMAVGSIALAALALTSVSLQRSFEAANYQMTAQNDQLRVLDYLSRDLHMATAVSLLNDNEKITATLPPADATSIQLNLGSILGSVRTGGSTASTNQTVSYYVEGGQLIRELNGVQTSLADTVAEVHFDQNGLTLTASILFTPHFSASATVAAQQVTRATSYTFLRNATLTN